MARSGHLGHPYSAKVSSSVRRRLRALGAKAGKSWGAAAMENKSSYPKTHAGVSSPMTVSGKNTAKRADRQPNKLGAKAKYANGGLVSGGGGGRKRHGGHTTNIIISHAGGRGGGGGGGGRGVPVPVPRPVPVPVRPAMPPALPPGLPPGGPAAGPPPGLMGAPSIPPAPLGGGLPPPALPVRPPGMMRRGGVVKKKLGGPISKLQTGGIPQPPRAPTTAGNTIQNFTPGTGGQSGTWNPPAYTGPAWYQNIQNTTGFSPPGTAPGPGVPPISGDMSNFQADKPFIGGLPAAGFAGATGMPTILDTNSPLYKGPGSQDFPNAAAADAAARAANQARQAMFGNQNMTPAQWQAANPGQPLPSAPNFPYDALNKMYAENPAFTLGIWGPSFGPMMNSLGQFAQDQKDAQAANQQVLARHAAETPETAAQRYARVMGQMNQPMPPGASGSGAALAAIKADPQVAALMAAQGFGTRTPSARSAQQLPNVTPRPAGWTPGMGMPPAPTITPTPGVPAPGSPVGGIVGRTPQSGMTGFKRGGGVKRQLGGSNPVTGGKPITKPPTIPPVPQMVPMPKTFAARRARPAPGTTSGYKRGGGAHDDVAEDKKLFNKMYAEKEKKEKKEEKGGKKRAAGGFVSPNQDSNDPALGGYNYRQQGTGFRQRGGPVMKAGSNSGPGRLAKSRMAAKLPGKTEV